MGGEWSTPLPGRFTPGKDPVSIVQKAGWTPGPVWTDVENLGPTGIRSPDRPGRSESLYRLSYPGPSERRRENFKRPYRGPSPHSIHKVSPNGTVTTVDETQMQFPADDNTSTTYNSHAPYLLPARRMTR